MVFEWDDDKNDSNIAKHGLSFLDALDVFNDPKRLIKTDDRKDYGEARWQIIGKIQSEIILFVVHTTRNEKIRVISARRANKQEQGEYNGNS